MQVGCSLCVKNIKLITCITLSSYCVELGFFLFGGFLTDFAQLNTIQFMDPSALSSPQMQQFINVSSYLLNLTHTNSRRLRTVYVWISWFYIYRVRLILFILFVLKLSIAFVYCVFLVEISLFFFCFFCFRKIWFLLVNEDSYFSVFMENSMVKLLRIIHCLLLFCVGILRIF